MVFLRSINSDCETINELINCYEQDAGFLDKRSHEPQNIGLLIKIRNNIKKYNRIVDYWDGRCTEIERGRTYVSSLERKLEKAEKRKRKKPFRINPRFKKISKACAGFLLGGILFVGMNQTYNKFSEPQKQTRINQTETTINSYLNMIDRNPTDYNLHMQLSELYAKNGMRDESIREYVVAKKLIKKNQS